MSSTQESILRELAAQLIRRVSEVAVRGHGRSCFLYVVGSGKSAEVSIQDDGFWVEFWDSLDAEAQPVSESTYSTSGEVEAAVIARLL